MLVLFPLLISQARLPPPPFQRTLPGSIPVLHNHGTYCYVPVSLGGNRPAWFILDSGGSQSFVTQAGLSRLKAAGLPTRPDGSLGELSVRIGGVDLGKDRFTLDTSALRFSPDPNCDGIIGIGPLSRCRIGIDLRKKQVRFWPKEAAMEKALRDWFGKGPGPRQDEIWPQYAGGSFCVQVEVDNVSAPMCLDTGSPGTYLSRELALALPGASRGRQSITFPYRTIPNGENAGVEKRSVRRYSVGGVALAARNPLNVTPLFLDSGILGCDVLESLRVLVDFPGRRIYVAPTAGESGGPAPVKYGGPVLTIPTGVTIRWPKGVVVRIEPGCECTNVRGYRRVPRPDGTTDLVPVGMPTPRFRRQPRMLRVPTVEGDAKWEDQTVRVPPNARYTVPPGWSKHRNKDGSIDLFPPTRKP